MFTVGDVRDLSLLKENGTDHVLAESLSVSALLVYHSTTSSSAHRLLCAQRAAYLCIERFGSNWRRVASCSPLGPPVPSALQNRRA